MYINRIVADLDENEIGKVKYDLVTCFYFYDRLLLPKIIGQVLRSENLQKLLAKYLSPVLAVKSKDLCGYLSNNFQKNTAILYLLN